MKFAILRSFWPKTKFRERTQASLNFAFGPKNLKNANFICNFTGFKSPKSKKEGHFRGLGIKFERKVSKYGN